MVLKSAGAATGSDTQRKRFSAHRMSTGNSATPPCQETLFFQYFPRVYKYYFYLIIRLYIYIWRGICLGIFFWGMIFFCLASGFWLLAFGFWLLAFGFWLLRFLASGLYLLHFGAKISDLRAICCSLEPICMPIWLLASGFWLLRFLASGLYLLHFAAKISDLRAICCSLEPICMPIWLLASGSFGFWLVFAAFWSQNL